MNTIDHSKSLPTEPRERCIALVQQGMQRAEIRQRIRSALEASAQREIAFGKINGVLHPNGSLVVKPPRNIAWRIRGRFITLSLHELLDKDDRELRQLLPQH